MNEHRKRKRIEKEKLHGNRFCKKEENFSQKPNREEKREVKFLSYGEVGEVISQVRNIFENVAKVSGFDFRFGGHGKSHSRSGV